ncbi:ferredoxin [Blastococcus sp. TF02A-26]|uniref:ferredoxin n=1 Tax=Blastococcus sp. TF02A-26 TaxID=2250577 RepID=UPI000DEAE386|nr:ferredoxin [Blastococcus sp. TF02A-26]RBY89744.1 ferredoxin [Blastococcus sp. TF02A-26]
MTRVEVDRDRCISSGVCEHLAPEAFELDDDGVLQLLPAEPDPAVVAEAVRACPSGALTLADRAH